MKIKTRLVISLLLMVFLPVLCIFLMIGVLGRLKLESLEKMYGVDASADYFVNSLQAISETTDSIVSSIREEAGKNPDQFLNFAFLQDYNTELQERMSYLVLVKNDEVYYKGINANVDGMIARFSSSSFNADSGTESDLSEIASENSGEAEAADNDGTYFGGNVRALVRKINLQFSDGSGGSLYVVSSASALLPQIRNFIIEAVVIAVLLLALTASLLMYWLYRGIKTPIDNLRKATQRIASGDYNFKVEAKGTDEISDLCRDFETMREKLQQSEQEKTRYDKESRELISNISHDLKTPITAVKGYVEGIMDGVADTPEKMDRYIKTIYNKTNDMDRLINELTTYSKIDTNRMPYHFTIINVAAYFEDCAEEVNMELQEQNLMFTYTNNAGRNTSIIADPEQLKRVISNIISNSVKYMDKPQGKIDLRIMDAGDFIQVEIEDNGKGIDTRDLVNIFDRSYRTDAARNSSTGGSGLGLSIAKKIIEDHSGKIWARSELGHGTTMCFVIRKYQEGETNSEQGFNHRR